MTTATAPRRPRAPRVPQPEIVEMPAQTMAVVSVVGDPNEVSGQVFPALYGAVYTLKFALKKQGGPEFKVSAPRARWPNLPNAPKDEWRAEWGLPIPDGIAEVPQKVPATPVRVEVWHYGTVAQILHIGTYAEETPNIERLHAFIAEQGYEIAGDHEEEYLTQPDAKVQKTIIRYPIRKRG